jgi:hypothetical protein
MPLSHGDVTKINLKPAWNCWSMPPGCPVGGAPKDGRDQQVGDARAPLGFTARIIDDVADIEAPVKRFPSTNVFAGRRRGFSC